MLISVIISRFVERATPIQIRTVHTSWVILQHCIFASSIVVRLKVKTQLAV